jgi:hypothetical protein
MSAASRLVYLAALADKAREKIQPLIVEFQKIKALKDSALNDLAEEVAYITNQIDLEIQKGNNFVVEELTKTKTFLIDNTETLILNSVNTITQSIVDSVEAVIGDIDGISVSVEITNDELVPVITPDPINLTTDFVKSTILDPTTLAVVSTIVTGTAGGTPVTGVGTASSPLTTT